MRCLPLLCFSPRWNGFTLLLLGVLSAGAQVTPAAPDPATAPAGAVAPVAADAAAVPAAARGGRSGRGRGAAVAMTDDIRAEIQGGMDKLSAQIVALKKQYAGQPLYDRIADAQVYVEAVRLAMEEAGAPNPYNLTTNGGVFPEANVTQARADLAAAAERLTQLAAGQTPWMAESGVRGYFSRIDGSAQPYLLTMPVDYNPAENKKYRLDIFEHGRGDTSWEMTFIAKNVATANGFNQEPTAPDATRFILQPWGRWCNATRFAGEIDTLEAIAAVKKAYAIDENRIVMTGFSMGGASAWLMGTHHAEMWAAFSAGAGFTETKAYLHYGTEGMPLPPQFQQTLWHLYDSADYALNTFDTQVVAYSSDIDPQKQAADAMQAAMLPLGLPMEYILGHGANPAHSYTQAARQEIMARLDQRAAAGRDPSPKEVHFTTWMLRYHTAFWISLDGMDQEWQRAEALGRIDNNNISLATANISALHLTWTPGLAPWDAGVTPKLIIDGMEIMLPSVGADKSLNVGLVKTGDHQWQIGEPPAGELRKSPGLQGPIDDAFMDSFLVVRPTGTAFNPVEGKWTMAECDRAIKDWQVSFRGDARVKNDAEITDADIANNNLILFGDPSSNAILQRIADKLPIKWTAQNIIVGDKNYPSANNAPVMIYPNPLNPAKYIVINSGFTFHEFSSNDKMNPKLPDWAVVDFTQPGDINLPTAAVGPVGFFDEAWKLQGSANAPAL